MSAYKLFPTCLLFLSGLLVMAQPELLRTPLILDEDQSGIGYGKGITEVGDVNGDGYSDVLVRANTYSNGQNEEGAAYLYLGSSTGLNPTYSLILEGNQDTSQFGGSMAKGGDLNGDGYGDILIGAERYANGETWEGVVFVYYGSSSGITAVPDDTLEMNQLFGRFGSSVACAGDVNADGYDDVIVGAPGFDLGGTNDVGAVFVFHGSASGVLPTPQDTLTEGVVFNDRFGLAVASASDVNGDGYDDVLASSPFLGNGEATEGIAYLYLGSANGVSSTAVTSFESNVAGSQLGWAMSSAGDVNGDGFGDIVLGAFRYEDGERAEGGAFVFHGNASGASNTPAVILQVDQRTAFLGRSLSSVGDVNLDGYNDIVVGAHSYTHTVGNDGIVLIYYGSSSGLSNSDTTVLHVAAENNAHVGRYVSAGGDINGDGFVDVLSATSAYDNGGTDEGGAFVFYGSAGSARPTTLTVYDNDLTTLWNTNSSKCDSDFGIGLFAKGSTSSSQARVIVEYISEGETFTGASQVMGSYQVIGTAGAELKITVPLKTSKRTLFRARAEYDLATANDGVQYSEWNYPLNQFASGIPGGDIIRWDGSGWCKGSGTNNAPSLADAGKRLFIEGASAQIAESCLIEELIIEEGADLTVLIDQCLTVNSTAINYNETSGSFKIEANNSGRHGNYNGPSIENAEIQMGISSDGWHYVSVPMEISASTWASQNDSADIFLSQDTTTQNLWTYKTNVSGGRTIGTSSSHAAGKWDVVGASDNLSNLGLALYMDGNYNGAPQVLVAQGTTTEGNQTIPLYNAFGGWNLVNNPYSGTLDLAAVYGDNNTALDAGIHMWNTASGNFGTYDASSGISTNNANGQYLSIGQAFFVRPIDFNNSTGTKDAVDNSTNHNLTIEQNHMVCDAVTLYKTSIPVIKLNASFDGSNLLDQLAVAFDPNWTDGYSRGEDIEKFFAPLAPDVPGFFVRDQNHAMAIGKYTLPVQNKAIPLGLTTSQNGMMTIEMVEVPMGWEVYLTDHKEGKAVNLSREDYPFMQDQADGLNRFELFVSASSIGVDEVSNLLNTITSYQSGENALTLSKPNDASEDIGVTIMDLYGRTCYRSEILSITDRLTIENLQFPSGMYIVKISRAGTQEEESVKILWK